MYSNAPGKELHDKTIQPNTIFPRCFKLVTLFKGIVLIDNSAMDRITKFILTVQLTRRFGIFYCILTREKHEVYELAFVENLVPRETLANKLISCATCFPGNRYTY